MKFLFNTTLLVLTFFCNTSFASENRHAVHLELLGKSVYYGTLTYEFDVKPNFTVGTGWGFMNIYSGKYFTHNMREGRYFDLILTNQHYALHRFFYKGRHRLIAQYGLTIQNSLNFVRFNDGGLQFSNHPFLVPFAGTGYEFKSEKIYLRFPVYVAWIGVSDWFPALMPWFGLSVGIPLF